MKIQFSLIIAMVFSFFGVSQPTPAQECPQHCDNSSIAIGFVALNDNTTGSDNVAIGPAALANNTTGSHNIAIGSNVFANNIDGNFNIALGTNVMNAHSGGDNNVTVGHFAMYYDQGSQHNVALGNDALFGNFTGINNTALGYSALYYNTFGDNNIALDDEAGLNRITASNNIAIGNKGVAGESNTIRIGKKGTHTFTRIAGISGITVAGGVTVVVDTNGQLGTITSSDRYKDSIKPMDKASESILALTPVTFCYKKELDPEGIPQFGLVAEDVEKVNPDLVARDEEGKPYTVRYEAVNAMLLNEFLKEHRTVQELKKEIAALTATVKEQAAQIQKVSAQVELTKPAPRTVLNNH